MNLLQYLRRGRPSIGLTLGLLATAAVLSTLVQLPSSPAAHAQLECRRRANPEARSCPLLSAEFEKAGALATGAPDLPTASLHEIFHADGQKVGEVFVTREPGAATYVEHWVMFDTFEYPDVIQPANDQPYASAQDFLQHVPFGPGYRYARWDVVEQSRLPGR